MAKLWSMLQFNHGPTFRCSDLVIECSDKSITGNTLFQKRVLKEKYNKIQNQIIAHELIQKGMGQRIFENVFIPGIRYCVLEFAELKWMTNGKLCIKLQTRIGDKHIVVCQWEGYMNNKI